MNVLIYCCFIDNLLTTNSLTGLMSTEHNEHNACQDGSVSWKLHNRQDG